MGKVYIARMPSTAITTAKTLLQVKAGASKPLEILRAYAGQQASETSDQLEIQLLRKSAAATVTSFTPLKFDPADPAADAAGGTAATGYNASAEGTDGDILPNEGFNVLNGWFWLPTPEERIIVPVTGIIALKLGNAPAASTTMFAYIIFKEHG